MEENETILKIIEIEIKNLKSKRKLKLKFFMKYPYIVKLQKKKSLKSNAKNKNNG